MTEEQQQLIRIIANQLFGVKVDIEDVTDWYSIMKEAQQQTVFPLAYQALKSSLPAEQITHYSKEYANYQASFVRNLHFHAELHKLLNGIPYVILKGQASAVYYPNPMLRIMGDVDFLIAKSDIAIVDELLTSQGFKKISGAEKHEYHWAYKKNRESLEMHWDVPGIPERNSNTIKYYLKDIINNRRIIQNSEGEFAIPSEFHHGLVLLLHTISHLTATGVGLRHLCDWLVFENGMTEEDFVETFEKPLKDIGLWTFAKVMTKCGVMYFGCKEREWCKDANESVCTAFMEDIFAGGNFGIKDNTRRSQAKLIRNNVTRRVTEQGLLKNVFVNISNKAKQDYPVMKKLPVLLPVGWGIISTQYLFRVASGKRNNVLDKTIFTDAMSRKKLYSELKLFEK